MNTDQIYIDTVREQIRNGAYDHLIPIDGQIVFVDIGANTGEVTKHFFPFTKRAVAIEPAPETYRQLVENVDQRVECRRLALAPVDGLVEFFVNDINFTASSTVNTYGTRIEVEGRRLSTILIGLKLDHVDVCKIDAEGGEGESLSAAELAACSDIVKCYYIEVHNCPKTTWEHKLGTLVGNLARCGYAKMQIDGMAITASK